MNKKHLIWIGRFEGLSLLLLMFIAMPLKYIMHEPELVKHMGRAHGGLFLLYVTAAMIVSDRDHWPRRNLMLSWVFSCLPFGTFYFERKHLKN